MTGRLAAGLLVAACVSAGAAPLAWITNQGSHDVSVVDLATRRVVSTVPVGRSPAGVVALPARGEVVISNADDDALSVLAMQPPREVARLPVGRGVVGLDASTDGRRVFAADWYRQRLKVFDLPERRLIADVPLGRAPAGVAALPGGLQAWVAERDDDRVALVDVARAEVIARVPVGQHPFALLLDTPRQRLYALNVQSDDVSVIDARSHQVLATLKVGKAPYGAALADEGRRLYITNQHDDTVSVFNADTLAPLATLTGFGYPEGIAAQGQQVLVVNWMDDDLSVLEAASGRLITRIPLGRNPRGFGAFIGSPTDLSLARKETPLMTRLHPPMRRWLLGLALATVAGTAAAHGPTRQKVTETVRIDAPAATVWARIKDFAALQSWHPAVEASPADKGNEVGSVRQLKLKGGGALTEALEAWDDAGMKYTYRAKDGGALPVTNYTSTIRVSDDGGKAVVEWRGAFYRGFPNNDPPPDQNDEAAVRAVTGVYQSGLAHLKKLVEGK